MAQENVAPGKVSATKFTALLSGCAYFCGAKKYPMSLFRYLPFLFFIPLFSTGCAKQDDCQDSSISLDEYLTSNNITAETGTQGLRYRIMDPGEAAKPTISSAVTVNYTGYTTDRDTFDMTAGSPATFRLGNLIQGWQQGIPLVGTGGRIQLFIPSVLAYGPNAAGSLCANTELVFEIELVSFQ